MVSMGFKFLTGIIKATINKGKTSVTSIDCPDVYKAPDSENSYIIIGKFNMNHQSGSAFINAEDLNEEGLTSDNIKIVMEYTKYTKGEAIRALRETEDDSV